MSARLRQSHAIDAGAGAVPPEQALALAALAHALDAVAVFADGDGRLLYANAAFTRQFGPASDRAAFEARFEHYGDEVALPARPGEVAEVDALLSERDRWYRLRWYAIDDRDGGGALCVNVSDVTERMETLHTHKAYQEQLLFTAKRMSVGEMATTLAHELNQPLAAIINYLSYALSLVEPMPMPPPRLIDALGLARAQAQHAAGVIATMREFVRAREPQRERHDLGDVVAAVMRLLQLEAQKHQVRTDIDIPAGIGPVYIDRVMIEQVLLNLVKNAIEAMAETPAERRIVRIHARVNLDDQAEVRVADRGAGLSGERAADVFKPFVSTKPDGLGVGLAICRSIVEYHEGRLFFEPNPDGGSVFVFTLPRGGDG